jgi:hypothetical protein
MVSGQSNGIDKDQRGDKNHKELTFNQIGNTCFIATQY